MKLKHLYLFLLTIITFAACKSKNGHYVIYNQIPTMVDVSELINSEKYSIDSCDRRVKRLIKTNPFKFTDVNESDLQFKLRKWKSEYNTWLKKHERDTINFVADKLFEKTTYQYSYFITDSPVDVYRTDTKVRVNGIENMMFFIRVDDMNEIYSDYSETNWIDTKCDTINSRYQSIYKERKLDL